MLKIQDRVVGAVTYLDVEGHIAGEDASRLKAVVDTLVSRNVGHVAINLAAVTKVDSLGLGTLVLLQRSAAREGTGVCLLRLTRHVHNLLIVTRLIQCFECFDSDEQIECWAAGTLSTGPTATAQIDLEDSHGCAS